MPGERQWYVVQTYASYENRVEADLKQRIAAMNMQVSHAVTAAQPPMFISHSGNQS